MVPIDGYFFLSQLPSVELGGLLKYVRISSWNSISKAKAARLVRSLLDLFDMEAATGQEVSYLNDKRDKVLFGAKSCFGEVPACTAVVMCKGRLGGHCSEDLSCQFLFVAGHLILWVCSMLCFVRRYQWSLESSWLHQGGVTN